jgi:Ca2+/Na+ antiporter
MVLYTLLVLLTGIAIVVYGADEAIKGLLSLSRFFRLSAFVTGVVIAGTLAVLLELSIGVLAALQGSSSFGLGLILGANVADLTLVIGVVVLLAGKQKMASAMLRNLKISFAAVLVPVLLLLDGEISQVDGIVLVVGFLVYVSWLLVIERKQTGLVKRIVKFRIRENLRKILTSEFLLLWAEGICLHSASLLLKSTISASYDLKETGILHSAETESGITAEN